MTEEFYFEVMMYFILLLTLAMYFIPFAIAAIFRVNHLGWVFIANLVTGWTLIGWFLCFIFVLMDCNKHRACLTKCECCH